MQYLVPILLFVAILCLILKNNFLMFFISLEMIVLAINLNFIFFSLSLGESKGLFVAVLLLVVAAIDTAIGLSLLIKYHNLSSQISVVSLSRLKA